MPENNVRPRNRPNRASNNAASVPNTTAIVDEVKATFKCHPGRVQQTFILQHGAIPLRGPAPTPLPV